LEMGRGKTKDGDVISVEEDEKKVARNVDGRGFVPEGLEVLPGGENIWVLGNVIG